MTMKPKDREALIEIASEAVEIWIEDGQSPDDAIDRLARAVDLAIDFERILGPAGALAEEYDEQVARAILVRIKVMIAQLRPDPDRLRERARKAASRGRHRLAARRLARAERLEIG